MNKTNILGIIDTAITVVKNTIATVDTKLSNLSLAEKVLIGLCWFIITVCVMFPGFFWSVTGVAVVVLAIRLFYHKKKSKAVEPDNTVEAEVVTE